MRFITVYSILFSALLVACGNTAPKTTVVSEKGEEVVIAGKPSEATIESVAFFANMSEMLTKSDDAMQTDKDGTVYDLCDVPIGGAICFALVKNGKGVYKAKSIEGYTGEGFETATVELRQVGDIVMMIGFSSDNKPLWTMRGFGSEEAYNQYRDECFADMLTGTYKDGDGQNVVFGDDHTVTGLFGVSRNAYQLLPYMDYTSEVAHIDGTDLYFSFAFTDEGIDIYNVQEDEDGGGERMMGEEVLQSLMIEGAPQVKWAHQHPINSDFVMAFISPAQRLAAMEELKSVKKPSAVEAWNLFVLEAFEAKNIEEVE